MSETVRSFTLPLRDLLSTECYDTVDGFVSTMDSRFKSLLGDKDFMRDAELLRQQGHKGYFWKEMTKLHSPHLSWPKEGNRAKFYRMILAQVFETFRSLEQRQELGRICAFLNWDSSQMNRIRELCTERSFYPTNGQIRNVLRYGKIPEFPTGLDFVLDYRQGDSQVVRQNGSEFEIQVGAEWVSLYIQYPDYIRGIPKKLSKPKIYRKDGDLLVDFAYWVDSSPFEGNGVLGIDLGKIKSFAGAALYPDGEWTYELTGSKEAKRLAEKIDLLTSEIKLLQAKMKRIEKLLKGKETTYLAQHYLDLDSLKASTSRKRTTLKSHLSWVIARDIVNLAKDNECSEIHVEDLRWLDSKGGRWDHAAIQNRISQVGELNGVSVEIVHAQNSSHTDPFTGNYVVPNRNRELPLDDGASIDRDHGAALELAYRKPKKKKKAKVVERPVKKRLRTKTGPTPKRPKIQTRRKTRILERKAGHSPFVSASVESQNSAPLSSNDVALTSRVVDTRLKYHGFR